MTDRGAAPDPLSVTGPQGESLTVFAQPSGVIGWHYEASALPEGIPVAIAGALWNTLGRLAFRFGWSVVVSDQNGRRIGRRRFPSKRAALGFMPHMAEDLASSGTQALRDRPNLDHSDGLEPHQVARLDQGIAALERDGQAHGWVATTVEPFWGLGHPTRTQTCVWLLFTWSDGTREPIEEDYPPYALVPNILDGQFNDDQRGPFTVRWLTASERDAAWAARGIHP